MSNSSKLRSITAIVIAQIAVMSLWFVSSAIIADLARETAISSVMSAALSSSVQAGFVLGALISALLGIADRFDPRKVFLISGLAAAGANALMLVTPVGGLAQVILRFATGACLAGVYPVGVKIAVGWGQKDRGMLVGLLVGALTLGSAAPHFFSWLGEANWRLTIAVASIIAALGSLTILIAGLGPYHATAKAFNVRDIAIAWTNRRVRLAYAGYLGHMWELYAFWAWIGTALLMSFSMHMSQEQAASWAKLTTFTAIALGGLLCAPAGLIADRVGKATVAQWAMIASATAAIATALSFGGPPALTIALVLIWGMAVIPDSAQFSALVADHAPADRAGSLLTFQTALGFALTIFTVQVTPFVAALVGWGPTLTSMALGPVLGVVAMQRLRGLNS